MGIATPDTPSNSSSISNMNPTNSMYQGYHHAANGIFGFSNGFELRAGGFESSPPLEEEDSNVLPVYETSGMLSEMFDDPSGIVAVAATASTELLEQTLPPNYQGHMPADESKSDFNHQQLPSINAAAMKLFLMNPQPRSPSSSTSLQGPGGSSFGTRTVPNTVSQLSNPSEIGGVLESQGLSLSLSSSFPNLEVKDGEFLYYNQAHVGLGSSMGMVTALRNSKYAKDAQELLEEFCSVGRGQLMKNKFGRNKTNAGSNPGGSSSLTKDVPPLSPADRFEHQRRKVSLLAMLNEVDRRYKIYREQMKMLVNSLDQVMGNGAAVPYTALAQKAMSRHFRCLKDSISAQLKRSYDVLGEKDGTAGISGTTKDETPRIRMPEQSLRQETVLNQMGGSMLEQEPLRPQRCLPELSVNILRAWLFEHFLHPYPSDADKHRLARQTGLSRNQVSNWFINARVRLWKPMVEEMYRQETKEEDGERNPYNSSNNTQTSTPSSRTATASTPAGKTCEIRAVENDTSLVEVNRQCFSFSEKKRKQCSSLTATEVAAPPSSQPFTTTNGGDSLTLGLRHAGNMPGHLQMHFL